MLRQRRIGATAPPAPAGPSDGHDSPEGPEACRPAKQEPRLSHETYLLQCYKQSARWVLLLCCATGGIGELAGLQHGCQQVFTFGILLLLLSLPALWAQWCGPRLTLRGLCMVRTLSHALRSLTYIAVAYGWLPEPSSVGTVFRKHGELPSDLFTFTLEYTGIRSQLLLQALRQLSWGLLVTQRGHCQGCVFQGCIYWCVMLGVSCLYEHVLKHGFASQQRQRKLGSDAAAAAIPGTQDPPAGSRPSSGLGHYHDEADLKRSSSCSSGASGAEQAVTPCATALFTKRQHVAVKISHLSPDNLPPDLLQRMQQALVMQQAGVSIVSMAVRNGCAVLSLDVVAPPGCDGQELMRQLQAMLSDALAGLPEGEEEGDQLVQVQIDDDVHTVVWDPATRSLCLQPAATRSRQHLLQVMLDSGISARALWPAVLCMPPLTRDHEPATRTCTSLQRNTSSNSSSSQCSDRSAAGNSSTTTPVSTPVCTTLLTSLPHGAVLLPPTAAEALQPRQHLTRLCVCDVSQCTVAVSLDAAAGVGEGSRVWELLAAARCGDTYISVSLGQQQHEQQKGGSTMLTDVMLHMPEALRHPAVVKGAGENVDVPTFGLCVLELWAIPASPPAGGTMAPKPALEGSETMNGGAAGTADEGSHHVQPEVRLGTLYPLLLPSSWAAAADELEAHLQAACAAAIGEEPSFDVAVACRVPWSPSIKAFLGELQLCLHLCNECMHPAQQQQQRQAAPRNQQQQRERVAAAERCHLLACKLLAYAVQTGLCATAQHLFPLAVAVQRVLLEYVGSTSSNTNSKSNLTVSSSSRVSDAAAVAAMLQACSTHSSQASAAPALAPAAAPPPPAAAMVHAAIKAASPTMLALVLRWCSCGPLSAELTAVMAAWRATHTNTSRSRSSGSSSSISSSSISSSSSTREALRAAVVQHVPAAILARLPAWCLDVGTAADRLLLGHDMEFRAWLRSQTAAYVYVWSYVAMAMYGACAAKTTLTGWALHALKTHGCALLPYVLLVRAAQRQQAGQRTFDWLVLHVLARWGRFVAYLVSFGPSSAPSLTGSAASNIIKTLLFEGIMHVNDMVLTVPALVAVQVPMLLGYYLVFKAIGVQHVLLMSVCLCLMTSSINVAMLWRVKRRWRHMQPTRQLPAATAAAEVQADKHAYNGEVNGTKQHAD